MRDSISRQAIADEREEVEENAERVGGLTLTLDSPITEEQWDTITDVDLEHTDRIWFHTKHGKEVEFVKCEKGRTQMSSPDTISRRAAIDAFCKECYDTDGEICNRDDVCGNVKILKGLPSAQPEIIRCKDCKHYLCPHGCGHIDGMVTTQEDGFCNWAERREE